MKEKFFFFSTKPEDVNFIHSIHRVKGTELTPINSSLTSTACAWWFAFTQKHISECNFKKSKKRRECIPSAGRGCNRRGSSQN